MLFDCLENKSTGPLVRVTIRFRLKVVFRENVFLRRPLKLIIHVKKSFLRPSIPEAEFWGHCGCFFNDRMES